MSDSESRILPWPGPGRPPGPGPWPPGGWRPPVGPWPPGPPGPGPFPQPPDVFSAFAWLAKNYQEAKAAREFLKLLISDLIAEDPTFLANAHATVGVTDGSQAQPGMVGEVVAFSGTFAYTAPSATGPVTLGVLPPGDWNVWGWAGFSTGVIGGQFYLNPLPAGFYGNPSAALFAAPGATDIDEEYLLLPTSTVVARTAQPSLMAATAIVWAAAAGTMSIDMVARRMR